TPTGETVTTVGNLNEDQEGTPTFTNGFPDRTPLVPSSENPVKLIDPETGDPTDKTEIPALENGEPVGTYKINPETGKVTFTPNQDYAGTPDPAEVVLKDKNGTPAYGKYIPTVIPPKPTGDRVTTTDEVNKVQKGTPTFMNGNGTPQVPSAENPAKFIDPETGDPTDKTEIPALKDGEPVGTYQINPLTGEVTFTPKKDFVGTPDKVEVQILDKWKNPVRSEYQPTVTPKKPVKPNTVVPMKPADPVKPKLANTGVNGVLNISVIALLMAAVGTLAVATRRRETK
ncbi:LPXTG-motif cell wall anchor domain protein, partial [Gleimia coleocanis DSM 15436]